MTTDDPREILREAGVDVPEVDLLMDEAVESESWEAAIEAYGWDAMRSLARLAAKYKWQRDRAALDWEEEYGDSRVGLKFSETIAELDRRWAEK